MPATVIVGLQWGDEGKGKISYLLSREADLVARFQGGANAGHLIAVKGRRIGFHILPAGSAAGARPCVASGVVVDLERLFGEAEILRSLGHSGEFIISGSAQVALEIHRWMDEWIEGLRGRRAVGTTRRGVGPAYSDKALRIGVRVEDLLDSSILEERLRFMERMKGRKVDRLDRLLEFGKRLQPHIRDIPEEVNRVLDAGGRVVFEGAQGTLLDIDHGTYPYVTSSNTVAGAVCTGAGIGPTRIDEVVGVAKAYCTRVGGGPLPSEIKGELADRIRVVGKEFGTTTGRPRRIGWLDLVALRYAVRINHVSWIALTKLDALSGVKKLKLTVAYELDGRRVTKFPSNPKVLENIKPIYLEIDGWPEFSQDEWRRIAERGYDALPEEVKIYVETIEEYVRRRVKLISIGEELGMEIWRD